LYRLLEVGDGCASARASRDLRCSDLMRIGEVLRPWLLVPAGAAALSRANSSNAEQRRPGSEGTPSGISSLDGWEELESKFFSTKLRFRCAVAVSPRNLRNWNASAMQDFCNQILLYVLAVLIQKPPQELVSVLQIIGFSI
jgi:hypothetical protein